MRAQIHTAADLYERHFGRRTPGMWLGECGYVPGVDELLREAAVRYFFVDTHGLLLRRPAAGVRAVRAGLLPDRAWPRSRATSSPRSRCGAPSEGYPGDPHYRDFYRDIGFDLPMDYIGPYVHPEGHRLYTGVKYHAITHDQLHDKWVYDPDDRARARGAARRALPARPAEAGRATLAAGMDRPPIIVSPYDAELYGHWWFEGPIFLGDLFRQLHHDQSEVETITPGDYLERHPTNQVATPCASSWGHKGYNELLAQREQRLGLPPPARGRRAHGRARAPLPGGRTHRSRARSTQAARELLLAQSSDWPFIMRTGTTVPYATRRVEEHVVRFNRLYDELDAGTLDEAWLAELEARDNIFPDVDYRLYAS